jgi:hypothetical protein
MPKYLIILRYICLNNTKFVRNTPFCKIPKNFIKFYTMVRVGQIGLMSQVGLKNWKGKVGQMSRKVMVYVKYFRLVRFY